MADWHPCGKISITLIKLNPEWKALEKAAFIQGSFLRKYIYFRLCRIPAAFIDLRLLIDLNRAKEYKSAQCQYPIRNQFPEISKEECVQIGGVCKIHPQSPWDRTTDGLFHGTSLSTASWSISSRSGKRGRNSRQSQ